MHPVILFRKDNEHNDEIESAKKYFDLSFSRSDPILKDKFVIPRYSSLPYHKEFEQDLSFLNSKLINSTEQHNWIANYDYYEYLKEYLPESWDDNTFPYSNYAGPFVVKGKTNSRKHSWLNNMFAPTRKDAIEIGCKLALDSLISEQGIVYKKYIPLKTFEYGMGGIPFSNEWRFFLLGTQIVDYGYYWSIASNESIEKAKLDEEAFNLVKNVAKIASQYVNFYVIDIAEKESGGWIVIELNDACMSGLSTIKEDSFYSNLKDKIETYIKPK